MSELDVEFWLEKAREAFCLARSLQTAEGRILMLEIALRYQRLAAEAPRRRRRYAVAAAGHDDRDLLLS